MKIQCVHCKEIVRLGAFELLADRIRVTCAECDRHFEVRAADGEEDPLDSGVAAPVAKEPDTRPTCPKCGALKSDVPACGTCGLEAQHVEAYRARTAEASSELVDAWNGCLADWDTPAMHDAFAKHASTLGEFSAAARHYRVYLQGHPDDPVARAALDRLTRMAEVSLLQRPAAEAKGEQPYKRVVHTMLVLVLLAAMGGAYLLMKRVMTPDTDPTAPTPAAAHPADPGQRGGIVRPLRRSP